MKWAKPDGVCTRGNAEKVFTLIALCQQVYKAMLPPSLSISFSFLLHVDNTSVCYPYCYSLKPLPGKQCANTVFRRIISIVFDLLLVP